VATAPASARADDAHAAWSGSSDSPNRLGNREDPDLIGESVAACPVRFRARLPSAACAREVQRPVVRRLATAVRDGGTVGSRDAVSRSEP